LLGGSGITSCGSSGAASLWERVRGDFNLSPGIIDFSALLVASHPRPVRDAIEKHRRELDANPTGYLQEEIDRREELAMEAAGKYLGARPEDIALTDSTTMGLGLVYNGLRLKPGEEFLTTDQNYYSTDESLRLAAERIGSQVRRIPLYRNVESVSSDEIVENIAAAVRPQTRVLALTWVHSSTGLKLPLKRIGERLSAWNRDREPTRRILVCVDGVHALGVEDFEVSDLGCDVLVAGCHKWLFGPRGTGIIWANRTAWESISPTIPTFMDPGVRRAWMEGKEPSGPNNGKRMSPGGFKPFEHQWAMRDAFEYHLEIGKREVAARTHQLSRQLKEGLAAMPHVKLYTPLSVELSAGIVCFEVAGMTPQRVVAHLRERRIVATTTPYAPSYARLTPSVRNSPAEIDQVLDEIHSLS
jgi:selenocysteine lyase/cysteine desulfurase